MNTYKEFLIFIKNECILNEKFYTDVTRVSFFFIKGNTLFYKNIFFYRDINVSDDINMFKLVIEHNPVIKNMYRQFTIKNILK